MNYPLNPSQFVYTSDFKAVLKDGTVIAVLGVASKTEANELDLTVDPGYSANNDVSLSWKGQAPVRVDSHDPI